MLLPSEYKELVRFKCGGEFSDEELKKLRRAGQITELPVSPADLDKLPPPYEPKLTELAKRQMEEYEVTRRSACITRGMSAAALVISLVTLLLRMFS